MRSSEAVHRRCFGLWLVTLLFGSVSCRSDEESPQVGGETNFLRYCEVDCGDGLTCSCGRCTRPCDATSDCARLGDAAQCAVLTGSSTDSCPPSGFCDVACQSHADCAALGPDHRCELGFCRQGDVVCPSVVEPPGEQLRELVVDGVTRRYLLRVPRAHTGAEPSPLVLDFHPMAALPEWQRDNSGFAELGEEQGFIAAWPEGFEQTWNLGPCCALTEVVDDFGFVMALLADISRRVCIDPRRVYATGFSLGGGMAYYLGCKHAETFAALASSSMDLFADSETGCEPTRPVSVLSFRGALDTVVPYAGGASSPPGYPEMVNERLGAVQTFEKWAALDGCTGSPSQADAVGCTSHTTCEANVEVTLCTSAEGGQIMGEAAMIWQMFDRQTLP